MRDHIDHDFSMVGCSWGTKLLDENIRSQWKMAWKKGQDDSIMYANQNLWGPDQKFLHKYENITICFFLKKTIFKLKGVVYKSKQV